MNQPKTWGYWYIPEGYSNIVWNQNGVSEIMKGRGKHVEFRESDVLFFDNGQVQLSVPRKNKYDVLMACECFAHYCEYGMGSLVSVKEIRALCESFLKN